MTGTDARPVRVAGRAARKLARLVLGRARAAARARSEVQRAAVFRRQLAGAVAAVQVPIRDVVLIPGPRAAARAHQLVALCPDATVHVLVGAVPPGPDRRTAADAIAWHVSQGEKYFGRELCSLPQPQLVLDCGTRQDDKVLARFRDLFAFVQAGGAWVIELPDDGSSDRPDNGVAQRIADIAAMQAKPADEGTSNERELSLSCGRVSAPGRIVAVEKRQDYRIKLRDREATEILRARYGDAWGEVVTTRPATTFTSRGQFVVHGTPPSWLDDVVHGAGGPEISVPDLQLRRYRDVQAWYQQRVARDNYWLPDTFRHPLDRYLRHRNLVRGSPWHARLPEGAPEPGRRLRGSYFYFDSEYPQHFGHILTEVISRAWAWQEAVRRDPDVRPLLSLGVNSQSMPAFERPILEAMGVDLDRVEYFEPSECVRIESLYAGTPMFVMPQYAAPDLAATWQQIGAAVSASAPADGSRPRRLFIARKVRRIRSCLNTDEVEALFTELGFTLFYPEQHSFAEQIATFAAAEVIAGFGGSGMFSLMFAPPKTSILIAADSYTANNEYLIGSVVGGTIHHFTADSLIKQPPGAWTWAAYQSNFTFDVDRYREQLRAIVDAL